MQDEIGDLRRRLESAAKYLNPKELTQRREELELEASKPDLWDDLPAARRVTSDLARVSETLELYENLEKEFSDLEALHSLTEEAAHAEAKAASKTKEAKENQEAAELKQELDEVVQKLEKNLDQLELKFLLSGEYDEKDALCRIKSGAGGNDAQDWANMLLEMYLRWARDSGYTAELNSVHPAEGGGITSAEFLIKGAHAYGHLHSEHGVHRLVRISPFSKEGKRETSFASMSVIPLLEDLDDSIDIDEKDLRIDTYRSSGAGGQHVNVTDSAVRITHLPTGISVSCQAERSQHQNRERAMQSLVAELLNRKHKERLEELSEITGDLNEVDFGSQIRSYVMHPYQMVKDLRTDYETGNIEGVLGGDLDGFIQAYLRWSRLKV